MGLSVIWLVAIAVIVGLFVARGLKAVLVAGAVLVVMVIGIAVYNMFVNARLQ